MKWGDDRGREDEDEKDTERKRDDRKKNLKGQKEEKKKTQIPRQVEMCEQQGEPHGV